MKSSILKNTIICLAISLLTFNSCEKACKKGNEDIITQTLNLSDIRGIDLSITTDVTISQGQTQSIEVTGDSNVIEELETVVQDGIWTISLDDQCFKDFTLSIDITLPELDNIELSGTGDINVNDFTNQDFLNVDLSGTGNIFLNKFDSLNQIVINKSGTGDMTINELISDVNILEINSSGTGQYFGFNLEAKDCTVLSSGTGDVELTAIDFLDATVSGTGSVFFRGFPEIISDISGTGDLIDAN